MKCVCVLLLLVGLVYCDKKLVELSNLIDANSFSDFGLDSLETLAKDKCKKNGGDKAYKTLKDSVIDFKAYIEKKFDGDVITQEIESASKTGSLDEVFKKYCDMKPEVMNEAHKVGSAIEVCLENDEKSIFKVVENITEGLIDFACDKDGERIALFLVEDGFSCISSKAEKLQKCGNDTLAANLPTSLDKVPSMSVTKEQCNDYKKMQECVLNALEECSNSTPSNVVDSLLSYIYKFSLCNTLK